MTEEIQNEEKPEIKLLGLDGNAFIILGQVNKKMKQLNWSDVKQHKVMEEMQSGDLFLWDTIMFVVNGTVYFSGTIGKFSDDSSFGKLGW